MTTYRRALAWAAVVALFVAGACTNQATGPDTPSGPAPAPVTPPSAEDAAASAALAAYTEYWRVTDAARAAPSARDWTAEIERVSRGQARQAALDDVANYRSVSAHTVGTVKREPQVTEAAPTQVRIVACVDVAGAGVEADGTGERLNDAANQPPRFRHHAVVVADGGRWLVDQSSPAVDEPC